MIKCLKSLVLLVAVAGFVSLCPTVKAQDLKTANRLTESEQYLSAWAMYDQLIAKEPAIADNYYYYGESYLKSYFTDTAGVDLSEMIIKAKDKFKKGLELEPSNPLNMVGLGTSEQFSKSYITAAGFFSNATNLMPTKRNKLIMSVDKQVVTYQKIAEAFIKGPQKDTAKVFANLREAERVDKKNPETYLLRGDAYLTILNDGSNAIINYKRAMELAPSSPMAKLRLGQLWVRAKRYQDALAYYQEAIGLDSSYTPAYRELAELYAMAGQYDNAKKNYKKFLDLSQNNLFAKVRYASFLFLTKDYTNTVKQAYEVMSIDKSYNFLNRLVAYSNYELGKYEDANKAMETFFQQTKKDKVIPSDYSYQGKILAKLGKDSLAIESYKIVWKLDTTNLDILADMTSSYNKMKKYSETARIYEYKIKLGKASTQDYYSLGKTYYNMTAWGKADTALTYVITTKPEFLPAYLWKARVFSNLDPETKDGLAKPHYEKFIELARVDSVKNAKDLIEAYSYLGYFYLKSKKFSESLDNWEKVVAIDPNNEKAKNAIKDLKSRGAGK
ncbi:MAG: tetratricopeptide repeat protein [Bacteroidota bacterium]